MKKSILALAVAAALTAPLAAQADTILYGSARVSVDYNDEGSTDPFDNDNGVWDVTNNSSRLGVLGSEDLGGGLSAIYQYEFGVDVTDGGNLESNRPKYVGLKGGFGQISLGTQETPYYHVAGIIDIFNTDRSLGSTAFLGGSFNGFKLNPGNDRDLADGSLFRLENSLYYTTPDFNGFSAEAMLVMNGASNDSQGYSDSVDLWNLTAKYSNGPFFAGISYLQLDGDDNVSLGELADGTNLSIDLDLNQWIVGLGYTGGPFSVGLIYEQGTINEFGLLGTARFDGVRLLGNNDANNWYLTGEYRFGNNTIRAAYGQLDTGLDIPGFDETIDNYLVGYQYDFSKRTRIWVEYIGRSAEGVLYEDANAVSIGTRVDF
ncbi:MAG: porin [Candidatus Competibacter sp.]|jgi:predicted porin